MSTLPISARLRSPIGGAASRREVWTRAATHGALGFLPLALTVAVARIALRNHAVAVDFHHEFWPAAHRLVQGLNPYSRSWQHVDHGVAFPYPALTALVFVPLSLIKRAIADWIVTAVMIAAPLLTLRVLRVRDWRLYGLVLLWGPVVEGWQTGNLTLVLGLGIACLWRWRERPLVAGALCAVMVSLKPFIWPIGLWLLATRRYTAVGWAAVTGLAVNLVAWAVVGFGDLAMYRRLDSAVTHAMYRQAYTVLDLCVRLGTGKPIAYAIMALTAVSVVALCVVAGRRRRDLVALTLAIGVCMLATPVQWTHYFALLIVPLAIARPTLSPLWAAPLLLWVCPTHVAAWRIAVAIAVNATVIIRLVRRPAMAAADDPAMAAADDPAARIPGDPPDNAQPCPLPLAAAAG